MNLIFISSYTTYEKQMIASSELILQQLIWQTKTNFREDGLDYQEALKVRVMLGPTSSPFSLLFRLSKKYHKDACLM